MTDRASTKTLACSSSFPLRSKERRTSAIEREREAYSWLDASAYRPLSTGAVCQRWGRLCSISFSSAQVWRVLQLNSLGAYTFPEHVGGAYQHKWRCFTSTGLYPLAAIGSFPFCVDLRERWDEVTFTRSASNSESSVSHAYWGRRCDDKLHVMSEVSCTIPHICPARRHSTPTHSPSTWGGHTSTSGAASHPRASTLSRLSGATTFIG